MMNTMFRNFHILILFGLGFTWPLKGNELVGKNHSFQTNQKESVIQHQSFDILERIEKNSNNVSWENVLEKDGITITRKRLGKESIFALKATGILLPQN